MRRAGPDGWNRNSHYHERLLQFVPADCGRALDVGCGLGTFARRLSTVAGRVDAIDRDAGALRDARAFSDGRSNIRFIEADFMTWSAASPYDFVSMIAVLHHLPFGEALSKAADLIRPGGTLVVLGLDRSPSLLHFLATGFVARSASGYYAITRGTSAVGAPILEPAMTLREIREGARRVLAGAVIRRHLLVRYSLIWTKP